jgi:integrase
MDEEEFRADVLKQLRRAEKRRSIVQLWGATIYPPDKRGYWRIQEYVKGKAWSRSGGRTPESAFDTVIRLKAELAKSSSPTKSGLTIGDAVILYMQVGGPTGTWGERTKKNRNTDFSPLIKKSGHQPIEEFDLDVARDFLNSAGTAKRHAHLKNILGTLLRWSAGAGHLSAEIADHVGRISYVGTQSRPSRRVQASMASEDLDGEVPTHLQVEQWARLSGAIEPDAAWMIRLAAVTGLRLSELLALTMDEQRARSGQGNWIDLEKRQIRVNYQISQEQGKFIPPKRGKRRTVSIPPDLHIPRAVIDDSNTALVAKFGPSLKFSLNEWLRNATPNEGYVFPNSQGGAWGIGNLRNRALAPAANQMGWRMEPYETNGGIRALYRFTFHSLRARYATTAAGEWGFSRPQLQAQGGWEAGVVERFYQRFDDDVAESVDRLFNNGTL